MVDYELGGTWVYHSLNFDILIKRCFVETQQTCHLVSNPQNRPRQR